MNVPSPLAALPTLPAYSRIHFLDESSLGRNRRRFGHVTSVHGTPDLKSQTRNGPRATITDAAAQDYHIWIAERPIYQRFSKVV